MLLHSLHLRVLLMTWVDKAITWISPGWGQSRARARLIARHYEAASSGRRTDGWSRRLTDANSSASGRTLALLRAQARDLVRNNPWAGHGLERVVGNTVGWGIRPRATGRSAKRIQERFKLWGETTQCDAAGRLPFAGLQWLVMRTIVESGEVLGTFALSPLTLRRVGMLGVYLDASGGFGRFHPW